MPPSETPVAVGWLVGMMGVGKTVVGSRAARRLSVPFSDTDVMVEEAAGMTIPELFKLHGEQGFREFEESAVAGAARNSGVVATGGGVVLSERNRRTLATGTVIWLRADVDELVRRVGDPAHRPLLAGDMRETLTAIAERRTSWYIEVADLVVDTDGRSIDEVVDDVTAALEERWNESP